MSDLERALEAVLEGGWEHWGTLQCTGSLVVADPVAVGSDREPTGTEVAANFVATAREGTWHILVRRAPADKAIYEDVEIWELCACHEDSIERFGDVYDEANERAIVAIESGKACIMDAARRDDIPFREEVFWAGEAEIVDEAACTALAAYGEGEYPVFARGDNPVELLVIVFDWEDEEEADDSDEPTERIGGDADQD